MNPNYYDRYLEEKKHPAPNAVRIITRIRNQYDMVSLACSDTDPIPFGGFLVGRVYLHPCDIPNYYSTEYWKIARTDDPDKSLTIAFGKNFPIISNTLTETDLFLLSIV